jgi:type IV pilus assembly protein PilA
MGGRLSTISSRTKRIGILITAIHKSLAAKREMLKNDDKGFTLIELLVVVLLIGILTAIAVPVFIGQQDQARYAAAQSDLGVAKVAYVSFQTANGGDAPTSAADLEDFGYSTSDGVSAVTIGTLAGAAWCLSAATTNAVTNQTYRITDTGGAEVGACA